MKQRFHINIEIKAKCANFDKIRKVLKRKGALFVGKDHQVDTYFVVHKGRLKLREGKIENSLIYYERPNMAGPKQSNVTLFKSAPDSFLKEILLKSLKVLVVVDKQREIYFIGNVKFHLDTVKNLGSFVEVEAIDESGKIGKEKLRKQCEEYLRLLKITDNDLISESYSDLLMRNLSLRTRRV
ncbi:MAG TPA: class IV adenylate cyclase [Patescibacteria group bacterium]|nr:class IV adenylate cyclase [Patescibacteria group bacterium]HUX78951.1 class IV adenylate cyclase [Alphaproteobacteria bacterium]